MLLLIPMFFFVLNRLMADQSPSPPHSPSDEGPKSNRRATRLKDLIVRRANGEKTPVEIDARTGVTTGLNANIFQSYLGFLVREHISILVPSWEDVTQVQRDMLWQDVLVIFCLLLSV